MMGGYGSGRRAGKIKAEECRSLDVNRMHREGCLRDGWRGQWEWKRDGERVAWISMWSEEHRIVLSYNFSRYGGEPEKIEEPVPIVYVPCRFGGERPYFICPGVVSGVACRRRVVKLFGADRYFLCRRCYCIAYASQSEDGWGRVLRRANKIRMRLGGDPGMAAPFPQRPKGMSRRTYERLSEQIFDAEMRADEAFAIRAERLLARVDNRRRKRRFWR